MGIHQSEWTMQALMRGKTFFFCFYEQLGPKPIQREQKLHGN